MRLQQKTFRLSLCASRWGLILLFIVVSTIVMVQCECQAAELQEVQAENLLKAGRSLVERKHYLEALDQLEEARDILETQDMKNTVLYADTLFELAQTKIRGRLHQNFPANYVKAGLEEVQLSNKCRERLADIVPQKLAEGYYLEGYIQKKFFLRNDAATRCFLKAVSIDPGFIAAKRELSELVTDEKQK